MQNMIGQAKGPGGFVTDAVLRLAGASRLSREAVIIFALFGIGENRMCHQFDEHFCPLPREIITVPCCSGTNHSTL